MKFNWISLFQRLPLDIQRLIFEFDDTYHRKFKTPLFQNQLLDKYWKRKSTVRIVRELVYRRLENIIDERQFWNPSNGIFYIINGKMIVSNTYQYVQNIREDVHIYLQPYGKYLRWKLIPSASNLSVYNEKQMIYDGFIGNKVDCSSNAFQTMFFGDGRIGANHLQILDVPKWGQHIGDTYWC